MPEFLNYLSKIILSIGRFLIEDQLLDSLFLAGRFLSVNCGVSECCQFLRNLLHPMGYSLNLL